MLIPKCCKGCSGRGSGVCNCTLPSYCNEWVEDDETYPTNVVGVINTPNIAPLSWDTTQTDSSKNKDKIYVGDPYPCGVDFYGNVKKFPDCEDFKKQIKEKDHQIAVLENALNKCYTMFIMVKNFGAVVEDLTQEDFIEQAEKELKGNK